MSSYLKLFQFVVFCLLVNIPWCTPRARIPQSHHLKLVHADSMEFKAFQANKSLIGSTLVPTDSYESPLIAEDFGKGFFAILQFGEDPSERLVFMDSGASLLWIKCEPYDGPVTSKHPYNPEDSSTYQAIDCESNYCQSRENVWITCNDDNASVCPYFKKYATGEYSSGHLARESIKFGSSQAAVENILFGCSTQADLISGDGILGLGGDPLTSQYSLIPQVEEEEFSYCLGNISDPSYSHNKLIIGGTDRPWTKKTPLTIDGQYYINLISISFGHMSLSIEPRLFRRSEHQGGVAIDSGSTFTYLTSMAASRLRDAVTIVISNISKSLRRNTDAYFRSTDYAMLCYYGFFRRDLVGFPEVELRFEGGAVMEITTENLFRQYTRYFCLTVIPTDKALPNNPDMNVLGNMMQQYHHVTFDLYEKTVGFEKVDCDQV